MLSRLSILTASEKPLTLGCSATSEVFNCVRIYMENTSGVFFSYCMFVTSIYSITQYVNVGARVSSTCTLDGVFYSHKKQGSVYFIRV